jgi:hypothetical protein
MTTQRPEESLRDGGRTPLTVLQPRPELASGATLSRMAAASLQTAAAAGAGSLGSSHGAANAEPSSFSQQLSQQQSTRQAPASQPERAGSPDPPVALKLVMSPQRARTVISFDETLVQVGGVWRGVMGACKEPGACSSPPRAGVVEMRQLMLGGGARRRRRLMLSC